MKQPPAGCTPNANITTISCLRLASRSMAVAYGGYQGASFPGTSSSLQTRLQPAWVLCRPGRPLDLPTVLFKSDVCVSVYFFIQVWDSEPSVAVFVMDAGRGFVVCGSPMTCWWSSPITCCLAPRARRARAGPRSQPACYRASWWSNFKGPQASRHVIGLVVCTWSGRYFREEVIPWFFQFVHLFHALVFNCMKSIYD